MTPTNAAPASSSTAVLATAKSFLRALAGELRWRLLAAIAISISLAFAEGAGVLLLIPLLQSIGLTADDGSASGLASAVSRGFALVGLRPTLLSVLFAFVVVSAAHAVLYRANLLMQPALELRFGVALRERLYAAIVRSKWSFFITRRTSDLLHALTTEIDRTSASAYQMLSLFTGLAVSAVYTAVAFRLSPVLTILVAAAGAGLLWVTRGRTSRSGELGQRHADADRAQFHILSESISGLKVAKTFGAEKRDIEILSGHARARAAAYLDLLRSFARGKMGLDLASALLISALLYVAVEWLGLRGVGLLLLIFVFVRIMPRVMAFQNGAQVMISGLPSFRTVMRLIEEAEAHAERVDGASSRHPHRGGIRLEDVSFMYTPNAERALHGVSLSIPAGRMTAIVGASGAGKSTLADLLIGLLRPVGGRVVVDGQPLSEADLGAWRRSIGYVPQDGFLLHDTIRANLLWAVPGATDPQMWDVLSRAAAVDFVRARPEGLDTVVGDRGVRLSGGERQRLALARTLLTNPDLLVLDEATSALDSANEQQILDAVHELSRRITTVIITHRLSAIRNADVIHVLEDGRLAESGTWTELAGRGGAFSALMKAQAMTSSESDLFQQRLGS